MVEDRSRRKRDVSVYRRVRAEEEAAQLERLAATATVADADWARALDALRVHLPATTMGIWLEPLKPVRADDATLFVTGPDGILAWAERRYASLVAEVLAEVSDFTTICFVPAGESA